MTRDFRIPRLYKTLLAVVVVLGPIYWLMLTDDGRRRTDLVLMHLLGRPAFDAAVDAFSPTLTEERLRESFPGLELACADGPNPFGERLCTALIGSFNQYPAQSVIWYFAADRLTAVKLIYQRAYHEAIRDWVKRRVSDTGVATEDGQGISAWPVAEGALVMKSGDLAEHDEPALFWLSPVAAETLVPGATDPGKVD